MKNSLPKPEEQKEFSRGVYGERRKVKSFFLVNQNVLSFAFPAFSAGPARGEYFCCLPDACSESKMTMESLWDSSDVTPKYLKRNSE